MDVRVSPARTVWDVPVDSSAREAWRPEEAGVSVRTSFALLPRWRPVPVPPPLRSAPVSTRLCAPSPCPESDPAVSGGAAGVPGLMGASDAAGPSCVVGKDGEGTVVETSADESGEPDEPGDATATPAGSVEGPDGTEGDG